MALSTSVGLDRKSRIVGYTIKKGNFANTTPNLPQRIALLAEANTANQGALSLTPVEITSLKQAGDLYGFGSPIYNNIRILRPSNGGGIGAVPVFVYPQAAAGGAVAAARDLTPTGTATANGTHTVVIGGREGIEGVRYDINIVLGDNPVAIVTKIIDAVNAAIAAPVIVTDGTGKAVLTAKWEGLTSEDLTVTVNTNNNEIGVTYAVVSAATGLGTPLVAPALALFGSIWNTIVVNTYGIPTHVELETFNGKPDDENPTGRYAGIKMIPFIALYGDLTEDPSTITNVTARKIEVTNAVCPAPNSPAFAYEAAANMAVLFAVKSNNAPHGSINGLSYSDMPIPADGIIGAMATYEERDSLVKKGSSTIDLVADRYQVQDFVTTYHPDGEDPAQFAYCRNLMLDFNVTFSYRLLEEINVIDKTIAADNDTVSVSGVIKPKQWKQIVDQLAIDLGKRALIADVPFMQASIVVELSGVNPDRLETNFSYKRTGITRIASTTATAGFNFGELS